MRLLLIAYEFPPSPSPQALRWCYLAGELVRLGHEVHVLTIDLGGSSTGLPAIAPEIRLHRTFAGPARGLLAWSRDFRARRAARGATARPAQAMPGPGNHPVRNWKQASWHRLQEFLALFIFPDLRGEWYPWARSALQRILEETRPDVVISSHEPATTLQLGLLCKAKGLPWVADLGDPVLAPYTPPRWRSKARRLESAVCRKADHITVTSAAAAALIAQRHGRSDAVSVMTQGFDGRRTGAPLAASSPPGLIEFDPERLELLYTGSFYRFRRPRALLEAIQSLPGVRLSIAAVTLPDEIVAAATRRPDQIRLLGFLPHLDVLELQSRADVLINIANDDAAQIPGKLYEYLGAGRPILHLCSDIGDEISELLKQNGRGEACINEVANIAAWLGRMLRAKKSGMLSSSYPDSPDLLCYSWAHLASRFDTVLRGLKAEAGKA